MVLQNKATILGSVSDNPEKHRLPNGEVVVSVQVVTVDRWREADTGEYRKLTEKHDVLFVGDLAQIAMRHLIEGDRIYVQGHLQTREWRDESGMARRVTEIVAEEMAMLGATSTEDLE